MYVPNTAEKKVPNQFRLKSPNRFKSANRFGQDEFYKFLCNPGPNRFKNSLYPCGPYIDHHT
jgi:hypothetical protein